MQVSFDPRTTEQQMAEQMMHNAWSTMRCGVGSYSECSYPEMVRLLQLSTSKLISKRWALLYALVAMFVCASQNASALIVENMTGTTSAPADDPGWNFVTGAGSRAFTYLGNGWALSAFHVGVPENNESIIFNGASYKIIPGQEYTVPNGSPPPGVTLTALTDLRLIRINGDVGSPTFSLASSPITESTPIGQREVVFIGAGPTRQAAQSHWNVTVVGGNNNDVWTEVAVGGTYHGYKAFTSGIETDVKRWGTNQIADEDSLFGGGNDNDLYGKLSLNLQVGQRDIMSMVTQFDQGGLPNEAQVVGGDSGSAVFYKRGGQWELIGIVNASYSSYENQFASISNGGTGSGTAMYGNYTTFADLSFYHNEILNIMNANQNYSVMGDINLDGVVTGSTTGGAPTGDIAAFVAGWGYDNGTGIGTIDSWKHGDLNRDGKTDAADFVLLRNTVNPSGVGGFSLDSLFGGVGVPEPSSVLLALAGMSLLSGYRRRR
jgi:hypothetical protein